MNSFPQYQTLLSVITTGTLGFASQAGFSKGAQSVLNEGDIPRIVEGISTKGKKRNSLSSVSLVYLVGIELVFTDFDIQTYLLL